MEDSLASPNAPPDEITVGCFAQLEVGGPFAVVTKAPDEDGEVKMEWNDIIAGLPLNENGKNDVLWPGVLPSRVATKSAVADSLRRLVVPRAALCAWVNLSRSCARPCHVLSDPVTGSLYIHKSNLINIIRPTEYDEPEPEPELEPEPEAEGAFGKGSKGGRHGPPIPPPPMLPQRKQAAQVKPPLKVDPAVQNLITADPSQSHLGTPAFNARGFGRHLWNCCGCKLNDQALCEDEIWMLETLFAHMQAKRPEPERGKRKDLLNKQELLRLAKLVGKAESDPAVELAFSQLKTSVGLDGKAIPRGEVEFQQFLQYYKEAIVKPDTDGRIVEGPRVRDWVECHRRIAELGRVIKQTSNKIKHTDDEKEVEALRSQIEAMQVELRETRAKESKALNWLKTQKVCSMKARNQFWGSGDTPKALKKYTNHAHLRTVFEVVKTEDSYVRSLIFMQQVWYSPLANGTHGAPQLKSTELDSLFSTLFSNAGQVSATSAKNKTTAPDNLLAQNLLQRGVGRKISTMPDILSFQLQYFLPALMEEERKERPNIPAVFLQKVGGKRMADHLAMYTPYAANLEGAKATYHKLYRENPDFKAFCAREMERWQQPENKAALADLGLVNFQSGLLAMLGLPTQRVMRYRLLLTECGKHLAEDEPMEQSELDEAIEAVNHACRELNNESGAISQQMQKLKTLSDYMGVGGAKVRQQAHLDLIVPGRTVLNGNGSDPMFFELDLDTGRPRGAGRQLLLFNDLLLLAQGSPLGAEHPLQYVAHYELADLRVFNGKVKGRVPKKTDKNYLLLRLSRGSPATRQSKLNKHVEETLDDILVLVSEFTFGSRKAQQHVMKWRAAILGAVEAYGEVQRTIQLQQKKAVVADLFARRAANAHAEEVQEKVFFHEYFHAKFTERLDVQNVAHEAEWAELAARGNAKGKHCFRAH